ncbi:uncharacterized protein DUF930 [Agrobacterium vitis]|nr:uncharacterized protein DUF930 [Agrobacterium vitis]
MKDRDKPVPKRLIWGVGASVLLHVFLLLSFLWNWQITAPEVPKEEVVNVSIEPPPEEKPPEKPEEKPEEKPKDEPKPEEKPAPKPEPKPEPKSDPKPEEKPQPKPVPAPELRPTETLPPPPPPESVPNAFESAPKDETAPKEEDAPAPPPSEQPAEEEAKTNTAEKQGEDKAVAGDPNKQEPAKEASVLKDIAPPELGPDARPKVADKAEEAGGGIVTEQRAPVSEGANVGVPTASVPTPAPKPKQLTTIASLKPAKRIYSKDTLSDPRIKEALGKLPPKRRVVQMCSIEMLEQIRRNVPGAVPDIIAPTAETVENIDEKLMDVTDAAYHSRGQWFDVSYHCETDAKTTTITSFRFNIGSVIPKSQWDARRLPSR